MVDFIHSKHISLGEAILIALTGLPLLVAAYAYLVRKVFAFAVKIPTQSVSIGKSSLSLQVKARVLIAVERINFRFVEKRPLVWKFRDAPLSTIQIKKFTLDWRTPDLVKPIIASDMIGGVDASYPNHQPRNWSEREWLSVELCIEAHKPWTGYLSFEARTTERRLFVRGPFRVMEDRFIASSSGHKFFGAK